MAIARLHGYQGPTEESIEILSASKKKLFTRPRANMPHSAEWHYYADKIKDQRLDLIGSASLEL